ncbi:MAG: glycosyltransferase family 39 protein [Methanoregula sp.]|jgi:hypothetical protein
MKENRRISLQLLAVIVSYIAIACIIAAVMQRIETGGWAGVDAERFHYMARMIINGFAPYVSFIDPKPPLVFFVVAAMDLTGSPGLLDIPVITVINIVCSLLVFYIGNRDYGYIPGFFAGGFYLIVAAFVQGYFLFSEQFAVLFLLLAFISARKKEYIIAGIFIGLAFGFKQYAILGLIPLLYLMRSQDDRRYYRLVVPAGIMILAPFAALLFWYGNDTFMSAINWTFCVAPAYVSGQTIADIPNYHTTDLFSYAIALVSSIIIMLPATLFSAASVLKRGLRTPSERAIFLFAILFLGMLFVRQYLHYWILVLPFLALLACREFADDDKKDCIGQSDTHQ